MGVSLAPVPPIGPEALERKGQHVVGVSGGKDSVALACMLKDFYPEVSFTFAITPTGDELPEMHAHWAKLEDILGQPLYRIETISLQNLIEQERCLPNFQKRFCTRRIKVEPFMDYMDSLPPDSVLYVGLRADEEDRTGIQVVEEDTYRVAFPFQWHGWGIEEVTTSLELKRITIPKRTDCARCPLQKLSEWHSLYVNHPQIYASAMLDEAIVGYTYRSNGRDSWPASLAELAKEFDKGRVPKERLNGKSKGAACPWCAK